MRRATLTEAKNQLSALIDGVRAGGSVLLLDRGVPVARIEPVGRQAEESQDRLKRLERQGLARPPRDRAAGRLPDDPPPTSSGALGVVDALLEERRSGR